MKNNYYIIVFASLSITPHSPPPSEYKIIVICPTRRRPRTYGSAWAE